MSYVLIKDNVVIQKSDSGEQEGFIPAPDDVICGMIKEGDNYIRPPRKHRFTPEQVLRRERKNFNCKRRGKRRGRKTARKTARGAAKETRPHRRKL